MKISGAPSQYKERLPRYGDFHFIPGYSFVITLGSCVSEPVIPSIYFQNGETPYKVAPLQPENCLLRALHNLFLQVILSHELKKYKLIHYDHIKPQND